MKSLKELEEIRNRARANVSSRKDNEAAIRIVVGMATCGIAAGARPVLAAFVDEVHKRNLGNVVVSQTGCIGVCRLEPLAEVFIPGQEKVTYVNLTPEAAREIVSEHVVNGRVLDNRTIGAFESAAK
jgi:NADP-reducing hydrogenase subunit HndB